MRIVILMLSLLVISIAQADVPATQPSNPRPRVKIYSDGTPLPVIEASGPVRLGHYVRPFAPKDDPHTYYRNRYIYGHPSWSPYLFYGWGGRGWYGWHGYGYAIPWAGW